MRALESNVLPRGRRVPEAVGRTLVDLVIWGFVD